LRFIDANVFVHAFLDSRRPLQRHELEIKESAKRIVLRLEGGESMATTVVQLSEVANIFESRVPAQGALEVLSSIISLDNLTIFGVSGEAYRSAFRAAEVLGFGVNDSLAYNAMKDNNIAELYSFDRDFDSLSDIKRLTT
jgi:predicted nucleic acid-binding protein